MPFQLFPVLAHHWHPHLFKSVITAVGAFLEGQTPTLLQHPTRDLEHLNSLQSWDCEISRFGADGSSYATSTNIARHLIYSSQGTAHLVRFTKLFFKNERLVPSELNAFL